MAKASINDARWIDPFIALEESIEELIRLAGIRFDVAASGALTHRGEHGAAVDFDGVPPTSPRGTPDAAIARGRARRRRCGDRRQA